MSDHNKRQAPRVIDEKATEEVAEGLAVTHSLDAKRLKTALKRIITCAEIRNGRPYTESFPGIGEVFENLEPQQALDLLEKQNIDTFRERLRFAQELADYLNNFYSLADWETALSGFLKHQESNLQSLLETGYPQTAFELSPSLDWQLGCLYFVKLRRTHEGSHHWTRRTGFENIGPGSECGYRDASFWPYLEDSQARQLDNTDLRRKVFRLKHNVINKLLSIVRRQGPKALGVDSALRYVEQCFKSGSSLLNSEESDSLSVADERFMNFAPLLSDYGESQRPLKVGGLSDLITVVGDVTAEIGIRAKSDVRVRLNLWNSPAPTVGVRFDLRAFYQDYATGRAQWFEELFNRYQEKRILLNEFLARYRENRTEYLRIIVSEPSTEPDSKEPASKGDPMSSKTKKGNYLRVQESDSTVVVNGEKYSLTDKYYRAIAFMVRCHKDGNPYIKKDAVYDHAGVVPRKSGSRRTLSVRVWFIQGGGDARKFVDDGWIQTGSKATCRIPIDPGRMSFVTAPLDKPE